MFGEQGREARRVLLGRVVAQAVQQHQLGVGEGGLEAAGEALHRVGQVLGAQTSRVGTVRRDSSPARSPFSSWQRSRMTRQLRLFSQVRKSSWAKVSGEALPGKW